MGRLHRGEFGGRRVPAIPASLVETAGRYGSYRSATLADWSPTRREMLITTRFADTAQLHL